jgi:hypothetical protein
VPPVAITGRRKPIRDDARMLEVEPQAHSR